MTRPPDIKSKSDRITFSPSSLEGKQKVRDFKKLCIQDGLSVNELFEEAINHIFKIHHYPPGNPQLLLEKFQDGKLIEHPKCKCGKPSSKHGLHLQSKRTYDYCSRCFSEVLGRYDNKIWSWKDA